MQPSRRNGQNGDFATFLIFQDMEIIKLNARSRDSAETTIRYHLGQIEDRESEETSSVATATEELSEMSTGRGGRMWSKNRALVIDGKTLIYILDREDS